MQHYLASGDQDGHALLNECVDSRCESCAHRLVWSELQYLAGRPIIVQRLADGSHSLFECSHCAFRDISWRSQHATAQFSKLNAPLDNQAARFVTRQLGDEEGTYLIVVVV